MSKLIFNRPGLEVIITPRAVYIGALMLRASDKADEALRASDHIAWQDALRLASAQKEFGK